MRNLGIIAGIVAGGVIGSAVAVALFLVSAPAILPDLHTHDASLARALGPRSWHRAVERAAPSVINLRVRGVTVTTQPSAFPGIFPSTRRFGTAFRAASAVQISPAELITSYHAVRNAQRIFAEIENDQYSVLEVVGVDEVTDLALLRYRDGAVSGPPIRQGSSLQIEVGDPVAAIGNPYGVGQTVTQGIISATSRGVSNPYVGLLQTDAAINPGNSGGALIDAEGRLLGICSHIVSPEGRNFGVGFAIPVEIVTAVAEELRLHGRVRHGWLGFINAREIMPRDGQRAGILLLETRPGSPLDQAGLVPGDLVTEIDGVRATGRNLRSRLVSLRIGETVRVLYERHDQSQAVEMMAAPRPGN